MSITNWTRLEPDTQTNVLDVDLDEGVAARIADPLWLLGRQWQMGELSGEDAASPVVAHLEASSYGLAGIRRGDAPLVAYDAASTAVEALIEHDGAQPDDRTRAVGGISLVERLTEADLDHYATAVASHFPFRPGTPDGVTILAVHDAGGLRANLGVTQTDRARFDAVVDPWVAWFRPRAGRVESPAWIPDRLEYRFDMTASVAEGTATLSAPEHSGGALEWFTFSGAEIATTEPPGTPVNTTVDVAPTLLHIAGMPALTFWEVEDPSFDPGRIDAAPGDTARLLVVEAALAIAADWFLVPLRLPVAALSRIDHLLVTDTFGVTTEVPAADTVRPHPGWKLWRIADLPYLMLPPPAAGNLISEPDEQVTIVRDENANLAWALQLVPKIEPSAGAPSVGPAAGAADLTYVPITPVDGDRVPLVLVEVDGIRRLVRGRLAGEQAAPTGTLVGPEFILRDEELPNEGLVAEHRFELGRTPDGALHLWSSRAKRIGARAPASGLLFDLIT
jgi:hypothetical protein